MFGVKKHYVGANYSEVSGSWSVVGAALCRCTTNEVKADLSRW